MMSRSRVIMVLLGLAFVSSVFLLLLCWRQGPLTENVWRVRESPSPIMDHLEKKQYDKAVTEALARIRDERKDYLMYQSVAQIYLIRAREDGTNSARWVGEAVKYTEKALSLGPADPINLYQAILNFELAGDLSDDRCKYYESAVSASKTELQLLQGDRLVVEGRNVSVEDIKNDVRVVQERITKKIAASCK